MSGYKPKIHIYFYIYLVVPFTVFFIFVLCGLKLLSTMFSFQPEGFPLEFLEGLLITNSLSFCLSQNGLIFPSFFEVLPDIEFLASNLVFFSTSKLNI